MCVYTCGGMYMCVCVLCILCACVHVVCPTSRVRECDTIPLVSFMGDENLSHHQAWLAPAPPPTCMRSTYHKRSFFPPQMGMLQVRGSKGLTQSSKSTACCGRAKPGACSHSLGTGLLPFHATQTRNTCLPAGAS